MNDHKFLRNVLVTLKQYKNKLFILNSLISQLSPQWGQKVAYILLSFILSSDVIRLRECNWPRSLQTSMALLGIQFQTGSPI